jgi:hypothetical protein
MIKKRKIIFLSILFTTVFLFTYNTLNTTERKFYSLDYGLKEQALYSYMGKGTSSTEIDDIKEITYYSYDFQSSSEFPYFTKVINKEFIIFVINELVVKRAIVEDGERITYHWGL